MKLGEANGRTRMNGSSKGKGKGKARAAPTSLGEEYGFGQAVDEDEEDDIYGTSAEGL